MILDIPGYQVLAKIYESDNSIVYRGRRENDDLPVVLKLLKSDYPSPAQLAQFRHEYQLTKSLNLPGIVKAYDLHKYENKLVLVLEDFGGESLRNLLTSEKLTILGFLTLAMQVAESLGEIHTANIIHRDINSSNILFNSNTEQVKISDFSISTISKSNNKLDNQQSKNIEDRLNNQKTDAINNKLTGTLTYISPEQTGRMNRTVDYRTDFYSLGVTYYELLTQRVPFTSEDPMELIHAHIAKQPISPEQINPEIPVMVACIVMKLLAKNPEDRYQSAWGLIADLEVCLTQWETEGEIADFPLGKHDISDQFKIPQKLYGRQTEIAHLINDFYYIGEGRKKLLLVSGYSGIGKSVLVQTIAHTISRKHGYFISGKFDQFQRSIPYSAVVHALSELVRLLLGETNEKLQEWRDQLLATLGNNGQILIDVIPELEFIIGPQPAIPPLGATESQNRFNLVFQNFIRLFCQAEHPLVIFLDDLQWADSASLKLIKLMMTDEQTQYFLLIGAYRDNEVNPTHPLMMTVSGIQANSETESAKIIDEIHLQPLELNHICQLIAETLHSDRTSVEPLAELILEKTAGNPFFINEFLKTLYQEKLLKFDPVSIRWQWRVEEIAALNITDNVVELMIGKLQKLPTDTQAILSLTACIGNQFDLNTLSLINEKESITTFQALLPAIQEGLILPSNEAEAKDVEIKLYPFLILNYRFLHDRVQQAAYSLIADAEKQAVHLQIGRLLLSNTPTQYRLDRVFDLVDHLNVGMSLITDELELIELTELNLEAGKKAKSATAYVAAKEYFNAGLVGLEILTNLPDQAVNIWQKHYQLTCELYKETAIIEYLNGDFAESEKLINLILEQVQSPLEKAEIYKLLVIQYTLRAQYEKAIKSGMTALSFLNIDMPNTDHLSEQIQIELATIKTSIGEKNISELINIPKVENPIYQLALGLLTDLLTPTYMVNIQLWQICVLKAVNISLEFGSMAESCLGYNGYGILLAAMGEYQAGYQFSLLGLQLTEKYHNLSLKAKACVGFANTISYWFQHIRESHNINNEGYQAALESGDLEYGGYTLNNTANNSFFQGKNIQEQLTEIGRYLQFTRKTKNQLSTDNLSGLQLILGHLDNQNATFSENFVLSNQQGEEKDFITQCQTNQDFYSLGIFVVYKAYILYLFNHLSAALNTILEAEKYLTFITSTLAATEFNFIYSLILTAIYQQSPAEEQVKYQEILQKNQEQMKIWANNCPANFRHQYCLIEAELARIAGNYLDAVELYEQAIAQAKQEEFTHHFALANELAGKFWLGQNKPKYANLHLRDAYYADQRWGAYSHCQYLEQAYPQLKSLLNTRSRGLNVKVTAMQTTTTDPGSGTLDFTSIMKASQAISSEIVLDKLLAKLMKILIENAGAQTGFLLLAQAEQLVVKAKATIDSEATILEPPILVANSPNILPLNIINYVERSHTDLVLNHAVAEGQFSQDEYISHHKIKSVLCSAILNAGKLLGILYLENNLTVGAFTPERLEVLKMLSTAAAISLENALLYASVEQKVQERTQELNEKNNRLEQTLRELQRTQTQLIQSEKMSSLGQMVAGVAHEINNPVGFIYGNLTPAGEYVADLLNLIEMYQENYPEPVEEIAEEIENIDLEFLVEDLQKLLASMKLGAERIRDIVLSLRNFSRLDEADMKPVNIHEGIDGALLILHTRIKEKSDTRGIEIIKEYGKLPEVTCYASQLNQVFMNILTNAIDALEVNRNKTITVEREPAITIKSEVLDSKWVRVLISDNGTGMSPDILAKIFDPFFSTKPIGSGTGLGLSISYSIVVEKHGGKINCVSEVGKGTEFIIDVPVQQAGAS